MATVLSDQRVLSDELLQSFGERAPTYDRENRFFAEDFEDLRLAGYLELAVPTDLGGSGLNLAQVCHEQRRLAYRTPATALATNMHIYWTGLAADLLRTGDSSCKWILEEAASGEVFAAGHGEGGNDFPVMLSTTRAERAHGGYRFYGHKIFGSLTPVWTRLGMHAMDTSDPAQPKIVHAFLPRDSEGFRIVPTWDALGMRATRSDDTILEGAFVSDNYIARVVPAGLAGADLFVLGIFAWAEPTFANIYVGVAQRAIDLAVASLKKRTSIGLGGRALAYHPMLQHEVAEMTLTLDGMIAHVD
ncbi:MAG: acyl-CoA/acyl-ACP dehydrogenase, partial [Chloroflexota bacterium]|nr:acyl-CoA/acyl-ACP dehydrogenase [Chloroflexota bacterium]